MTPVSSEDIGAETAIKLQMAEIEELLKSNLNDRPLKSVIISAGSRSIFEISEACKRLSAIHNIVITATLAPLGNGMIMFTWRNLESGAEKPVEAKKVLPDQGAGSNRLLSSHWSAGTVCTPTTVSRCTSSCQERGLPAQSQLTTVTETLPKAAVKFDNGDAEFEAVLSSLKEQGGNVQSSTTHTAEEKGVAMTRLQEQFTKHHAAGGTLSWSEFVKLNVVILNDAYAETLVNRVLYACLNNNNNYIEGASSFVYPVVVDCGHFHKCVVIAKDKLEAKFPGYGYTILSGTDVSNGYTKWFIKVDDALRLRKTLKAQESR